MKWRLSVLVGVVVVVCGSAARAEDMRGQQLQYTVRVGDVPAELAAQFGIAQENIPAPLVAGKKIALPFVRADYTEKLRRELADRERALIAMSDKSHMLEQENTKLTTENARLVAEEVRTQGLKQDVTLLRWTLGAVSIVAGVFLVILLWFAHVNKSDTAIIKELRAKNLELSNAALKMEERVARDAVKTKPRPIRQVS